MNIPNRIYRIAQLLLVLALGFLANQTQAETVTSRGLITELRKSLAQPAGPNDQRLTRYPDQFEALMVAGRHAELEQALLQFKSSVPAGNERAAELVELLLTNVRLELAEAAAKQDATYNAIAADFVAKFEAKAPAADYDSLLQRLANFPSAQAYNSPNAQKVESLRSFVTRWQDYLLHTSTGNYQQAAQALNELTQMSARTPIIPRSRLATIQNEISAKVNSTNEVVDARTDAFRKKLSDLIDSAKSASDFDGLLAEIARPSAGSDNYVRGSNSQMERLKWLTQRWQDYFSQLEAGNGPAAQALLRELSNDSDIGRYYSRSKILAKMNGKASGPAADPDATAPLIPPDKLTLDTLDQFARQLVARRPITGSPSNGLEDLTQEAVRLHAVSGQVKFGNPQAAIVQVKSQNSLARLGPYAGALDALQQALILKALPDLLGVPMDLKPSAQDSVESYCARVLKHAREKKDWTLVYQVMTTQPKLLQSSYTETSDLAGFRSFFTAMQQEKAGLWTIAVRSYLAALRAGAPSLPVDEIGVRLARLKKDHPEEYATAEKTPNGEVTYGPPFLGRSQMGQIPPGFIVDPRTGQLIPEPLPKPPAQEKAAPPESPKAPDTTPTPAPPK